LLRDEEEAFTMTRRTKAIPAVVFGAAVLLARSAPSHAQSPDPLSDQVKAAVEEALQDEYRGEAMYSRVLKDHGELRPFSNVVHAERRHAAFLEELLKARGLAVPKRREETAEPPAFASVKDACAAAVEFETRNVALYDRLIAAGPLPDDVKQVFDHNRMASRDHHKPAFERCAGVATAHGAGRGVGRRWGAGHGRGCGGGDGRGQGHGRCAGQPCGNCGQGHGCDHDGCGHRCRQP
jgi:hypothetical protein